MGVLTGIRIGDRQGAGMMRARVSQSVRKRPLARGQAGASKSLQKALRILLYMGDNGPALGVTQLASGLSLNKTTVHRLLHAMEKFDLIERNPESDRYRLGLKLHELGTRAVESRTLRTEAHRFLVELSRATHETVSLAVAGLGGVVCLDRVDSRDSVINVRTPIGARFPPHCTAAAKATLAYLPEDEAEAILSIMGLTAFAVLMPACLLLILDHVAGTSFFRPGNAVINDQVLPGSGGSTLLWQHLFWFFGHPEVYIAIVPGMGIVSHVLITNMRRPMLSHRVLIYSMGALAVLSYMVYGHHMFVSGMNPVSSLAFSFPTLVITIPSTIIVLIWLGSLYGSRLRINSASLFSLGFVSMFISGGVSGFFLAQPSIDIYLHATYFVVGHFHLVMGVAAMFGIFAGTYFWFPKMTGRMMNETLGKVHFWMSFVGAYCIFMPFHYLGIAGNVRRYQAFTDDYLIHLIPVHKFITIAALFTGFAQLIFVYNLIHSRFWGKIAPNDNPWEGTSLEWSTATPPPHNNFGDKMPVVYHDPYQYSVEGASADYVMQTSTEQLKNTDEEK